MHSRPFWIAGLSAALALMASQGAFAALKYDLRVVGSADPKVALVTGTGQVVTMELWAMVTGTGAGLEGFQFGYGSVLSSQGGNIKGNLSATLAAPFNTPSAQSGKSQDLDNDGDLDLGSTATTQNLDFFEARSASPEDAGVPIADGQEFKLATIRFTATEIADLGIFTAILLSFQVTDFTNAQQNEALWQEDGLPKAANGGGVLPTVGTSVMVAVPEPSSLLLLGIGLAGGAAFFRRRR